MATLYIRDVPPQVSETLKRRAAASGLSLSAYVSAELSRLAERPTNAEVVERLRARDRSAGPSSQEVVEALHTGRR
ncbi:FitA-like ribbon-helix-helix domain-containing protein [Isoptericola chiayiensis]|nr:antitoxin [Isoptericola chiayiensis]NOW00505.1 plasmid stability protein [Isoptericola chiayiensis]